MWSNALSLIPNVLYGVIGVLAVTTRATKYMILLFTYGLVLTYSVKVIKKGTVPYLQRYPILQRPRGACDCGAWNTGGIVEGRAGFPSGHVSTTAFLLVGLLGYIHLSNRRIAMSLTTVLVGSILVYLVACARIHKRCHSKEQVFAGAIYGIVTGSAFVYIMQGLI